MQNNLFNLLLGVGLHLTSLVAIDNGLQPNQVIDDVVLVQVCLQFNDALVDLLNYWLVCKCRMRLELLRFLLEVLEELVLLAHVVDERLDVPVFHDLLVEKVLPDAVKLELACLDLSVDRLVDVHPEFLQELQTVSQLQIRSVNHVKNHLVLVRPVYKVMKSPPQLFDGHPRYLPSLLSQLLLSWFILQVKHLLVFEIGDDIKVSLGLLL